MDFQDVLQGRRSVRSYADQALDPCTLRQIIEKATLAPSAHNAQPWQFWALSDAGEVDLLSQRIHRFLGEQLKESDVRGTLPSMLADPGYQVLHGAPALVLVVADSPRREDAEDCCLAAMALMLAARDAGIGSCWIGVARDWFNLASTRLELALKPGQTVIAPIVLGYPATWPEATTRAEAKIHWLSPAARQRVAD